MTNSTASSRRWLLWAFRLVVLLLVGIGVSQTVRHALAQLSDHEWELRPGWLVASGAIYVVGMAPMAWFWHRILKVIGYPVPFWPVLRAYYFGQLGKYVPGKAMVVILRVAAVRRWAPVMRLVIASVFLETLTTMAVGATLAFAISVAVLKDAKIALFALAMAAAAGGPTLPFVFRRLAGFGIRTNDNNEAPPQAPDSEEIAPRLQKIGLALLAEGWAAAAASWILFAVSLWATLRATGVEQIGIISGLPTMITAVAFAVVAGFLSMLPGGLVVRDAVLMQLLAPTCGEANALIAAVLMRLIWLVSELVACGILYIGARGRGERSEVGGRIKDDSV